MKLTQLDVQSIQKDPLQPRKVIVDQEIERLSQSMVRYKQLTPVIVYRNGDHYTLVDGHRRLIAAIRANMLTLDAIVLEKAPSPDDLLAIQLVIECHRSDLKPFDQYLAFERLMASEKLSPSKLAERLEVTRSTVTRVLSIGKLPPELQDLVREGKIGSAKAYALARMTPAKLQKAVAAFKDGNADRESLEQLAKAEKSGEDKSTTRLNRVDCEMERFKVTVQSQDPISLDELVGHLQQLIRSVRKAKREGYDVKTFSQVLRSKAQQAIELQ